MSTMQLIGTDLQKLTSAWEADFLAGEFYYTA